MGSRGSRVVIEHDQVAWTDSLQDKITVLESKLCQLLVQKKLDGQALQRKDQQITELQSEIDVIHALV